MKVNNIPNRILFSTRNGWQGPDGPQDGGFNPGGGGGGWNDDSKTIGSWGEPPMPQNNSWNKPKTPTNPNSGWGDDGLVDVSNWGVPPKPTVCFLIKTIYANLVSTSRIHELPL